METQARGLVDPRLAKALSHPLRSHVLTILWERVASPKEIARMLGEPLPNVNYHVRALEALECVELVRTAQRRGATEHWFRALRPPFFSADDWESLSRPARYAISGLGLRMIWQDTAAALRSGTFELRPERHLSRSPLVLDEQGWAEVTQLLAELLGRAEGIAERNGRRLEGSGGAFHRPA